MSRDFVGALLQLKAEKQVPQQALVRAVDEGIQAAYRRVSGEEGCLSFPGIYIEVDRARHLSIEWQDLEGVVHRADWSDWPARIFQHEFDHLENVLLFHRMSAADRIQNAEALDELRRAYQEA